MDNATIAVVVLVLGAAILIVVIWQLFVTARARMQGHDAQQLERFARHVEERHDHLDARLAGLADDVQGLGRRVTELEHERRAT